MKIKRGPIKYPKSGPHETKKQKTEKPLRKQKHKAREKDSWFE